jgi:hypothetical protein
MVDWGGRVVNVAARPGCVVSLIFDRGTVACRIAHAGAYWCPPLHDEYGPPRKKNATIGKRGVLRLDKPLEGTRPTAPLAWQRYPHVDGFIDPWTAAGKLRRGLRFWRQDHGRCFQGSEETLLKSAITCLSPSLARSDPCIPQRRGWGRGGIAACADGPGYTTFRRWMITGRS